MYSKGVFKSLKTFQKTDHNHETSLLNYRQSYENVFTAETQLSLLLALNRRHQNALTHFQT